MCDLCNGGTIGDVLLRMHLRIAGGGWSFTAVQNEPPRPGWTYTTGLCTNFDHPELVITGVGGDDAADLLEQVCTFVREGDRFSTEAEVDINGRAGKLGVARFVEVHPAQLESTFANWVRYHGSLRAPMPELRALQLVVPDSWFCDADVDPQPLLDRAWPILSGGGNRAAQRAARRERMSGAPRPRRW